MARRTSQTRNARYRPFRTVAFGAYLAVVTAFCWLVVVSVVRSVLEMTPRRPLDVSERLEVQECAARALDLYEELEARRQGLSAVKPAAEASHQWTDFRVEWLNRLRQAEASCEVDAKGRENVARVFRRLENLEDLYTTSAVQYSGEMGPAVDGFRAALRRLRDGG
ncbi:MAG TPA: hypothetical protein VK454_11865 [Myxococcaceae bacterium]|nr:hypothetical protein [Myxococcaceae bacterium]